MIEHLAMFPSQPAADQYALCALWLSCVPSVCPRPSVLVLCQGFQSDVAIFSLVVFRFLTCDECGRMLCGVGGLQVEMSYAGIGPVWID